MNFPDQPHLHQLQEDLWQWPSSRAAVMVGAGLSLNTEPLPGVKSRFPTWRQLVWAMFDELYPKSGNETPAEKQTRHDHFSGINALRLASEYEAAFGRRKLELLIRNQNPDTEHLPSPLHELLLQLPWKDVFTTNYDTLLERTEVSGRAYQPVTTANELTTTFSPRIVKLHGSFPSQTPFIITEEDYRTYPERFAPFVNTVQQALIENSLVLIGFSGDDPNFLQWIGWIRDQLGDHHAHIYLVGPLSLSNAQRTLLERRGVTPIDLSPVFSGFNPATGIHAASLEWFSRSLLAAKPQRPEKWAEAESPTDSASGALPRIIGARIEPPPAPVGLHSEINVPLAHEAVARVISRWGFERKRYPGWLVAPHGMRSELWEKTKFWIQPIVQFIAAWPSVDRVLALRELNWRYEVSMIPLFTESIEPIERAVDELFEILASGKPAISSIDCMPFRNASHQNIVEAWLELAFGLLREVRETFNAPRWNEIKQKINLIVSMNSMGEDRCLYEQALWRVSNAERIEAKNTLAKWNPSSSSPLAAMWKAGLLAELDELSEARSLLRTALRSTRNALLRQGQNIELLSIEGWCTYLLFSVEQVLDPALRPSLRQEFLARWSELKAWDCDPWSTKDYFDEALSGSPPTPKQSGKTIVRGFDAGEQTISHHWSGDHVGPWLPAFACIRFFEQVGIPLRLPLLNISGDALGRACQWVAPFIGYWSPAILVRAGKAKELKNYDFMSRTGVAAMQPKVAQQLHQWGIDALTRELSALSGRIVMGSAQESLLEILPELLSRLAFKVDAAALEHAFQLALQFHRAPGIRSHIRLHETCNPWFNRIFNAATEKQLLEWLPALIRAPFVDEVTHSVIPQQHVWPDPMQHFPSGRGRLAVKTNPDLLPNIRSAADWLLKRAQSETGEARRRILARLLDVYHTKLMTAEQKAALGDLIWADVPEPGLPDLPLAYFTFLHLPVPITIDVVARIRISILALTPIKLVSINPEGKLSFTQGAWEERMIREVAMGSKPIVQLADEAKGLIDWSPEEARMLWLRALDWWNNDKALLCNSQPTALFDGLGKDSILATLERFDLFLARAVFPYMDGRSEEEWKLILDFISEAKEQGIYLSMCLPYILLHRPGQIAEVESEIRSGLLVDSKSAVEASALAVRHWIHLSSLGVVGEPDTGLLSGLINRVIFRRPEGIQSCIRQVSLLLVEKPDAFSWDTVQSLLASLIPWHGSTRLPLSEGVCGDFPEQERPDLRALLGMLSGALAKWITLKKPEVEEPSEIKLWRETCDQDSLPEVKRSIRAWESLGVNSED